MELSIMTHNLYIGLKELQPHQQQRSVGSSLRAKIDDYFSWISGIEHLDVVGLNELNGWGDDGLDGGGDHDAPLRIQRDSGNYVLRRRGWHGGCPDHSRRQRPPAGAQRVRRSEHEAVPRIRCKAVDARGAGHRRRRAAWHAHHRGGRRDGDRDLTLDTLGVQG